MKREMSIATSEMYCFLNVLIIFLKEKYANKNGEMRLIELILVI